VLHYESMATLKRPWKIKTVGRGENMPFAYTKDGKTVEIKAIYGRGTEGMILVIEPVGWGENSKSPFAKYEALALFTILEVIQHPDYPDRADMRWYRLRDEFGDEIVMTKEQHDTGYLYNAHEWARWTKASAQEEARRTQRKVDHLQSMIDLLKSILTPKGLHVVTHAQAKELGLVKA
jgi:hypothetical protein